MTRYIDLASALFAFTALAGCATLPTRFGSRSLLGGFRIMEAPTSELPIGALWQQGYGPIGPGAPAEEVATRRSFDSLSLSRAARSGLEIRMAEYLGLQPQSSAKLSATISEISVLSVRDPAKLGYGPGDTYVSDAMKASKITITTEDAAEADLLAGMVSQRVRVTARGSAQGQETLTFEGVDLFFAYRVVRLEKPRDTGPLLSRVLKRPYAPGW